MLVDPGSETIKRYGVLNREQGEIPHPTTLVVDRQGIVRFVRVDEDYRKRPSSEELLAAVRTLSSVEPGAGTSGEGQPPPGETARAVAALPSTGFEVGKPFPLIALPPAGGGEPVTLARFRGKKVILHIFASW